MRFPRIVLPLASVVLFALSAVGQSPNGTINGLVLDPSTGSIVGAEIIAVNDLTGAQYATKTNSEGIYVLPNLPPGPYRIQVSKAGFKTIIKPDIILNVQDALSINFTLPIGAVLETVTITGGAPLVNTESATVSTVVDRQFAENLPMNGRSFQALIDLTPGVVVTPPTNFDSGQFVEISYTRMRRAVVCRVQDPGQGFSLEELRHAAINNPPEDPLGHASFAKLKVFGQAASDCYWQKNSSTNSFTASRATMCCW